MTLDDAGGRLVVAAAWGGDSLKRMGLASPGTAKSFAGGAAYADPRLAQLGARFLIPRGKESEIAALGFARSDATAYDKHRLALGVPDGSRDLDVEKSILLENGFEELNGIDFQKGCYMGQELTARTKYRALVKKRLLPVAVEGPLPAPGTTVMLDGAAAGEIHSGRDNRALAWLRLEAVAAAQTGAKLIAGAARVTPQRPAWAKF